LVVSEKLQGTAVASFISKHLSLVLSGFRNVLPQKIFHQGEMGIDMLLQQHHLEFS